jgi:hypothetical protein
MRVLLAGAAGADGIVMDGLDRASVGDALAGVEPEVVIHQLTALATMGNLKKFDEEFAETNRMLRPAPTICLPHRALPG